MSSSVALLIIDQARHHLAEMHCHCKVRYHTLTYSLNDNEVLITKLWAALSPQPTYNDIL